MVVIVSADAEWRAVRQVIPNANIRVSGLGEWFVTFLSNHSAPILFFHGGWGQIASAASTQYVIDHCVPSYLINLGTCGGFEEKVSRGAIIFVERTIV